MRSLCAFLRPALLFATLAALSGCRPDADTRVLIEDLTSPTPVPDADRDGFSELEGDCDDSDAAIHPDAIEGTDQNGDLIGNGIDDNCDGRIDEGTLQYDDDRDGFSDVENDCDDDDPLRNPDMQDGCDGIDNDCDDVFDEDAQDAFEPNDTKPEATNIGDLTCNYAVEEINIDSLGDIDFFRFEFKEGQSCPFSIYAELIGNIQDLDFFITLYLESGGALLELDSIPSSQDVDRALVQFDATTYGRGGIFYVKVGSASGTSAVSCNDEVRLRMAGLPPI